ncbi:RNA 2'-phosphotransferase [Oribacterium sp. HCP28S3_H8]|uniref:RNA 2'-phosphotransferase n=1 Tax=Oribacterium sp. HCP28S3_H8 TaxID=3438945 RepID=UPI003F8A9A09
MTGSLKQEEGVKKAMDDDQVKFISKKMSYALRHNPDKYSIRLDEEGFTDLKIFLRAMNAIYHFEPALTRDGIQYVIDHSDKKRFEMTETKIRALYGHSFPMTIRKKQAVPPDILYHGTAHRFLKNIMQQGLLPMSRQYVHLSADQETARQVGQRRDSYPAILQIDAASAYVSGIRFYIGNDKVWLSDPIPPEYIRILV